MKTIELVLCAAALLGCFVYPVSLALRNTGARLAQDSERAYEVNLTQ